MGQHRAVACFTLAMLGAFLGSLPALVILVVQGDFSVRPAAVGLAVAGLTLSLASVGAASFARRAQHDRDSGWHGMTVAASALGAVGIAVSLASIWLTIDRLD